MSEREEQRTLEYAQESRGTGGIGCLILSLLFAAGIGIFVLLMVVGLFASGSGVGMLMGLVLTVGTVGILYWGVKRRVGDSAAQAIAIIAFCVFLLMFGTCAVAGFGSLIIENARR